MCASIHDALRCKDQDWKVLGPTAIACALFQATAIVTRGNTTGTEGYGRLNAGGWYLVRYSDARYDLRQITPSSGTGQALVATRSIASSPFSNDGGTLYFAGYDANKAPAHNTAWIFCASVAASLGASR